VADGDGRNRVLSYQWHVVTSRGEFTGGALMPPGVRVGLKWLVSGALEQAHEVGLLPRFPKTVYLVAHMTIADLSHLLDFAKIALSLGAVQKNLVTLTKPIPLKWTSPQRNRRRVEVYVRDTKSLSPVGGSLDAIGRSIGQPKIELPRTRWNPETWEWETPYRKDAMDVFASERLYDFMRYGENDAVIAARFFARLLTLYQADRLKFHIPRKGTQAFKKSAKTLRRWPASSRP
jgi:hypothetical protein